MGLLLAELGHILSYVTLALVVSFFFKKYSSVRNFFIGFAVTLLIDLDHIIDYFAYHGFHSFDIWQALSGSYFSFSEKTFVIFHGWEYVILLLLLFIYEAYEPENKGLRRFINRLFYFLYLKDKIALICR